MFDPHVLHTGLDISFPCSPRSLVLVNSPEDSLPLFSFRQSIPSINTELVN